MPPAAQLGWWEPDGTTRLVVATADPATLPDKATWYLAMNLPRPGSPREAASAHPSADLAEVTRIYGIRHWNGQSYKQVKDQLGWADFQARSDAAIRRPQTLVNCAFCFLLGRLVPRSSRTAGNGGTADGTRPWRGGPHAALPPPVPSWPLALRDTRLAFPLVRVATLVAGMVRQAPAPAPAAASPDELGCGRLRPAPLSSELTNYR
jgi:hypothetical protein